MWRGQGQKRSTFDIFWHWPCHVSTHWQIKNFLNHLALHVSTRRFLTHLDETWINLFPEFLLHSLHHFSMSKQGSTYRWSEQFAKFKLLRFDFERLLEKLWLPLPTTSTKLGCTVPPLCENESWMLRSWCWHSRDRPVHVLHLHSSRND